MNIKDIIVLGAGASKSEGAPLQNELFKEFFKYYEQNPSRRLHQEDLVIEYFQKFWGIDIKNYNNEEVEFPTFEECLGILDLAHYRGESFKEYSRENIDKTRNALIFLIGKILKEKLNYHETLVKRLKEDGKLKETAFINLNYDIIIDNVLTSVMSSL